MPGAPLRISNQQNGWGMYSPLEYSQDADLLEVEAIDNVVMFRLEEEDTARQVQVDSKRKNRHHVEGLEEIFIKS
jgi:hypothetical protein